MNKPVIIQTSRLVAPSGVEGFTPDLSVTELNSTTDACVMLIVGQSNAEGVPSAGTAFAGPATNVKVMGNAEFAFKDYDTTDNSVYRTSRSNTAKPLTEMAKAWQARIDGGEDLPDLYIIEVAFSGSGWSKDGSAAVNRWNADLAKGDPSGDFWDEATEGALTTNTSLYDTYYKAVKAGISEIIGNGLRPALMGVFQVGFEAETTTATAAAQYENTLRAMRFMAAEAAGVYMPRFFVTKLRTTLESSYPQANIDVSNAKLDDFAAAFPSVTILDPADSGEGSLFVDNVHYSQAVQTWFVSEILRQTIDAGLYGVTCRKVNA